MVDSLSHYLQGFIHPRWCWISSINSIGAPSFIENKHLQLTVSIMNAALLQKKHLEGSSQSDSSMLGTFRSNILKLLICVPPQKKKLCPIAILGFSWLLIKSYQPHVFPHLKGHEKKGQKGAPFRAPLTQVPHGRSSEGA